MNKYAIIMALSLTMILILCGSVAAADNEYHPVTKQP